MRVGWLIGWLGRWVGGWAGWLAGWFFEGIVLWRSGTDYKENHNFGGPLCWHLPTSRGGYDRFNGHHPQTDQLASGNPVTVPRTPVIPEKRIVKLPLLKTLFMFPSWF